MSKYLVICEKNGDEFITVHDTPEAATARAESDWGYLTDGEKRKQRIYTLCVSRDQLSGWAVDDVSGDVDWTCYESGSTYPGYYDSYREQNIDYYSYEYLAGRALMHGAPQTAIDNLGKWFDRFGERYWNGEYYEIDSSHRLYPLYEEVDADEYEIYAYDIR